MKIVQCASVETETRNHAHILESWRGILLFYGNCNRAAPICTTIYVYFRCFITLLRHQLVCVCPLFPFLSFPFLSSFFLPAISLIRVSSIPSSLSSASLQLFRFLTISAHLNLTMQQSQPHLHIRGMKLQGSREHMKWGSVQRCRKG